MSPLIQQNFPPPQYYDALRQGWIGNLTVRCSTRLGTIPVVGQCTNSLSASVRYMPHTVTVLVQACLICFSFQTGPAHPDYLPGGVQFGVDPLHPLQHQSAVRHSKTPRTVFSCRKNGQSSSLDSDSDTEDATEDEFGRRLSSGPSPLEVDDATCRHLSFSAGGATPSGMSGRRRANNA